MVSSALISVKIVKYVWQTAALQENKNIKKCSVISSNVPPGILVLPSPAQTLWSGYIYPKTMIILASIETNNKRREKIPAKQVCLIRIFKLNPVNFHGTSSAPLFRYLGYRYGRSKFTPASLMTTNCTVTLLFVSSYRWTMYTGMMNIKKVENKDFLKKFFLPQSDLLK